jgi:hypothetical protein
MIGLFRLTSEGTTDSEGDRWCLPKPSLVARLGQPNGPDIAWVRRAAELRRALKDDHGFEMENPEREPPKIGDQALAPPPPVLKHGLPTFTIGSLAETNEQPDGPPPPDCYDGPDDDFPI